MELTDRLPQDPAGTSNAGATGAADTKTIYPWYHNLTLSWTHCLTSICSIYSIFSDTKWPAHSPIILSPPPWTSTSLWIFNSHPRELKVVTLCSLYTYVLCNPHQRLYGTWRLSLSPQQPSRISTPRTLFILAHTLTSHHQLTPLLYTNSSPTKKPPPPPSISVQGLLLRSNILHSLPHSSS